MVSQNILIFLKRHSIIPCCQESHYQPTGFFIPIPLESNGQHQRSAWFGCACCPSNIARFVPAIPGYIYAVTEDELYVNLYISNEASITLGKNKMKISQKADFPWNGKVEIIVDPEKAMKFGSETAHTGMG